MDGCYGLRGKTMDYLQGLSWVSVEKSITYLLCLLQFLQLGRFIFSMPSFSIVSCIDFKNQSVKSLTSYGFITSSLDPKSAGRLLKLVDKEDIGSVERSYWSRRVVSID